MGGRSAGDVRDVVVAHRPGYRIHSVELLGEGEDNIAFEANHELIVRFGKESDAVGRAARVRGEARLLAAVADVSPLPVPEPVFTVAEDGCLAYFKLPGIPLIDVAPAQRAAHADSIAAALGEFLGALHAVPVARVDGLVEVDDEPAAAWLEEAAQTYPLVGEAVPVAHRRAVEAFLSAPPPPERGELVFSHNDLGIEHVLIDPATWAVTGIIDWSDAAITDAAYDFGLLYRDLGPAALDLALRNYQAGVHDAEEIEARAGFYARCSVLEDMAYGLQEGHAKYLDKGLTALKWLFPTGVR
ncbi:phosphotransferase family protein [Actinomadura latina]|uniref:Aminoglycoside phosphotransferase family protein n=1 Tax=Actinomadura latina TaxID=163603 RepID=A0A846YQL4_9ACTN|nr:aminoglycoside phosphotransferase family protein [Actinomadura latina]NKZ02539.1 aminoglycoside phosphotransferase family protein [Actinomadura latina]